MSSFYRILGNTLAFVHLHRKQTTCCNRRTNKSNYPATLTTLPKGRLFTFPSKCHGYLPPFLPHVKDNAFGTMCVLSPSHLCIPMSSPPVVRTSLSTRIQNSGRTGTSFTSGLYLPGRRRRRCGNYLQTKSSPEGFVPTGKPTERRG